MRSLPAIFAATPGVRAVRRHATRIGFSLTALLAAATLLWTAPVLQAQDDPQPPAAPPNFLYLPSLAGGTAPAVGAVIPGQFIVVLHDVTAREATAPVETAAVTASRLAASVDGEILFVYDAALNGFAVRVPPGEEITAAATLESDPKVDYVEPDRVAQVLETTGTQTGATWGLDRIDQASLPLNATYTYPNTGAGVHAYIIDTGVLITHTQFTGRVGTGFSAIGSSQNYVDCNGHGTHVAGTVGGTTYGVAKQVTIHPVRVLDCSGSGSNSGVIAGVNWVTANRQLPAVANMSLGGGASSALDTAVANSIAAGVTYAIAAGNDNQNACNYSPARTAAALTVGATTSTDARASYSNYGTCLDIFAPGSSITSAWYTGNSATASLSGTSMATPHVAGAAALYLAANPSAAPAQVAQALTGGAALNKVTSPGTGSPNRLLYVGFIGGGTTPTATPTTVPPTATPTPAPPTPTATPVTTPGATPTATPPPSACPNLLKNGGFESGAVNWTQSSTKGYALICTSTSCGAAPTTAHSGSYFAWLAGANSEASQISQAVTLPPGQKTTLAFWNRIISTDTCGYDYGYVRVVANGTTTNVKTFNLCSSTQTSGWVKNTVDLSGYAGQTVTLVFRATADATQISSFFVDDANLVSGSTCVAAADAGQVEAAALDGGQDLLPSTGPKPQNLEETAGARQ